MEPIIAKSRKHFIKLKQALQEPFFYVVDKLLKRRGYIFTSKNMKAKFFLPYVKSDFIQRYIYKKKHYFEYDNLEYVCKLWNNGIIGKELKDGIVLDIGANIGNHTLYFALECHAKMVYCFEPVPDTFSVLSKNIEINGLGGAKLINAAVGETSGFADIVSYSRKNTGMATLEESRNGAIKMVAIDDIVLPEKICLVKVDVEGFEISVIKGMKETLKRNMPYIIIETQYCNYETVVDELQEFGYKHIIISESPYERDCLFYM